jgi:hypothetical protein
MRRRFGPGAALAVLVAGALGTAMGMAPATAQPQDIPPRDTTTFGPWGPIMQEEPEFTSSFAPFGDLRLRGDFVRDLPPPRDELDRGRATLRAGVRWWSIPTTSLDVSIRASIATDHNEDMRRNFDNEQPDAFELDKAALRWTPWPSWTLAAGKLELPLLLTSLTYDDDLRPIGLTLTGRWSLGTFDALRVAGAAVTGDRFAGDDSRLYAGQLAWLLRDGAPIGGELAVALLGYEGLERDPEERLQRQNAIVISADGPRLAHHFGLIDVTLAARAPLGRRVAALRVDVVRNHRVDHDANGLRARLAWGEARGLGALELGYVFQRIEREAVPGSFNSDDWWFHTADQGHSAWLAIGLSDWAFFRMTGFDERRDDLTQHTHRLLLELTARLDPK